MRIILDSAGVGCEVVEWTQINRHPVAVYVNTAMSLDIPWKVAMS
jgi:hypothetical protein